MYLTVFESSPAIGFFVEYVLMIVEDEYDLDIPLQGAAKVSILMIGQQAIMDAYLCLLHLTAGILVGKLEISQLEVSLQTILSLPPPKHTSIMFVDLEGPVLLT